MNVPLDELQLKLHYHPYSSLAGLYNIRRHSHALRLSNLNPLSRHVSFRSIPTPPIVASSPPSPEPSQSFLEPPQPVFEPHQPFVPEEPTTARSVTTRPLDRRATKTYDIQQGRLVTPPRKREAIARPHTPSNPAKPPLRSGIVRKQAERRCKTATAHAEAVGRSNGNHTLSLPVKAPATNRPSTAVDPQFKTLITDRSPRSAGIQTRRSLPATKRFAADRTAIMRQTNSVPERPRTVNVTSTNNDHVSVRPNLVDSLNAKGIRRLSAGVPTHTAARAALRLAKATTDNE